MRVLFVNSANQKKRISPFILSQGESLKNNGIDLDFFTLEQGGLKGYFSAARKLRKLLKKEKYDIIHAHYALTGFISSYARRKEKLIVSLMGCDILGAYSAKGRLILYGHTIVLPAKLFSRYIWDFVILKSSNMIRKLPKKTKYAVVPNGVDFSIFKPLDKSDCRKKLGLSEDNYYLLFPTDPKREEKNFPLTENAFRLVRANEFPNAELLIVYKTDYEELVQYYNASDVCLMSSRSEGSPNVIKECMACNVPIVSTDVGDVREIIDGTEGCYISSHDEDDFSANIAKALEFNNRTEGRSKVQHLEINTIAKKLIDIYNSLLNE
jgi:teichuronic acid biosynthesis glycosyltransferase TuaC